MKNEAPKQISISDLKAVCAAAPHEVELVITAASKGAKPEYIDPRFAIEPVQDRGLGGDTINGIPREAAIALFQCGLLTLKPARALGEAESVVDMFLYENHLSRQELMTLQHLNSVNLGWHDQLTLKRLQDKGWEPAPGGRFYRIGGTSRPDGLQIEALIHTLQTGKVLSIPDPYPVKGLTGWNGTWSLHLDARDLKQLGITPQRAPTGR